MKLQSSQEDDANSHPSFPQGQDGRDRQTGLLLLSLASVLLILIPTQSHLKKNNPAGSSCTDFWANAPSLQQAHLYSPVNMIVVVLKKI
jgi:hypothetical protein